MAFNIIDGKVVVEVDGDFDVSYREFASFAMWLRAQGKISDPRVESGLGRKKLRFECPKEALADPQQVILLFESYLSRLGRDGLEF